MLILYIFILCQIVFSNAKDKVYYNVENAEYHFEVFKQSFNKCYSSSHEEDMRYGVFKENLIYINEMNRKNPHAVFEIDRYTDMTYSELSQTRTGLNTKLGLRSESCDILYDRDIHEREAPSSWSWVEHIDMNVKDQQNCAACWAFAATGNVEAQYALRYKRNISLSEQQLIDCDEKSLGCKHGTPAYAFRKLIQQGGQEESVTYPYVEEKRACKFSPGRARVRVTNCTSFDLRDEEIVKEVLFKHGPIVAAIDAMPLAHPGYAYGVITNACKHKDLNHAALIVGYGTSLGPERLHYWIMKNSWGEEWGLKGYFLIERGINCLGILNPYMSTSTVL